MPYTCKSCGRYSQGQSADGICPAPACVATRGPAVVKIGKELIEAIRAVERAAIVVWLRTQCGDVAIEHVADRIEAQEHRQGGT
jgi:hypothetical protein